jgi:hypothetical protein
MHSKKWGMFVAGCALGCVLILAWAGCGNAPGGANEPERVATVESAVTSGAAKINCGGPAVSPFIADTDSSGGSTVTRNNTIDMSAVFSPAPMAVYQSQRYGNFTYTLPGFAAGSSNDIRLHFCDTHWNAPGSRIFNVSINNTQVLTNFDIIATVGAGNTAFSETFTMPASSTGQYVIQFTTVKDAATVSGIEAFPTPPTIKINAGGSAVAPFIADTDFSGGATKTRTNTIDLSAVDNPAPMAVYQSQRYNNMTYTVPGYPAGSYNHIRLHFADTHWTTPNSRLFNVSINNTQVLTNFDIVGTAGAGNKALIETFTMPANSSGQYVIQFVGVKDAATVSGVEVAPFQDSAYAAQCAAAGVPLPPNWGMADVGPPGSGKTWISTGRLTDTFQDNQPASDIYFAQTTAPAGLCLINGHGGVNAAAEFDVICQSLSGKACFFAGTQAPSFVSDGVPPVHDVGLLGASWTTGGDPVQFGFNEGACTNCHAGQNVFLNHDAPGHPLTLPSQTSGWMPANGVWYTPAGAVGLQFPHAHNEGPDTFVEYPASTSGCTNSGCHTTGGVPGPFPRFSSPLLGDNATTYCFILQQAANRPWDDPGKNLGLGGMPPFPSNDCDGLTNCALQTDPFVLALVDECNGITVSRAQSPVALEGTSSSSPFLGTWDHVIADKWVNGFRQPLQRRPLHGLDGYGPDEPLDVELSRDRFFQERQRIRSRDGRDRPDRHDLGSARESGRDCPLARSSRRLAERLRQARRSQRHRLPRDRRHHRRGAMERHRMVVQRRTAGGGLFGHRRPHGIPPQQPKLVGHLRLRGADLRRPSGLGHLAPHDSGARHQDGKVRAGASGDAGRQVGDLLHRCRRTSRDRRHV